jgi:hypothetical protein
VLNGTLSRPFPLDSTASARRATLEQTHQRPGNEAASPMGADQVRPHLVYARARAPRIAAIRRFRPRFELHDRRSTPFFQQPAATGAVVRPYHSSCLIPVIFENIQTLQIPERTIEETRERSDSLVIENGAVY